jgi:hypothetical protein
MVDGIPVTARPVVVALPKVLSPVHVLLFASSVDEANVHVEVENEYVRPAEFTPTPPAPKPVREKLPEKMFEPLKVLLFARSVDDANVQVEVA